MKVPSSGATVRQFIHLPWMRFKSASEQEKTYSADLLDLTPIPELSTDNYNVNNQKQFSFTMEGSEDRALISINQLELHIIKLTKQM